MPVIVYQCTVCDRQIELQEQPEGLEVVKRCIITNECRGNLYKVERKEDFVVGNFPDNVAGLTNYIQRKVLYNHVQSIAESTWLVPHNLGVNPSVQVVVDRTEQVDGEIVTSRVEVEPERITLIDENNLRIFFDRAETGLAQCIARSSAPARGENAIETTFGTVDEDTTTFVQVSNEGVLTIATNDASGEFPPSVVTGSGLIVADDVPITLRYLDDTSAEDLQTAATIDVAYNASTPAISTSPWNDAEVVFVENKTFIVRSISFGDPVNDSGVANGTSVFFDQGNAEELRVLIALPPYDNVDKQRRQFFRPAFNQGPQQVLESFIFSNGEFFVNQNVIEEIFPPIYIVS